MSTAWMPPPGRHSVQIGQSLGRALKARRGEPAHQKSSKIPDKEFYSFRYNFKPEAVDPTKVGSIETRKEGDVNKYVIEKGSERPDEGYLFTATGAEPVKEWDCILIYDEETGRYTLEKVDTYLRLNFDRKTHAPRHAPSPAASTGPGTPSTPSHIAPPPRPGPSKPFAPSRKLQNDVDLDLENELLAGLDDADGSPDEDIPLAATTKAKNAAMAAPPAKPTRPAKAKAPAKPVARKEEEEESDGEILEAVEAASKQKQKARPEPVSAPPPASKTKPAPVRRPGNNLPVRPVAAAEPSVPKPKAPPAFQAKTKVAASAGKKRPLDVEEIDFARPAQPAKRPRPSSPPPQAMPKQKERERSSFSLALPTPAPAPKQARAADPALVPGLLCARHASPAPLPLRQPPSQQSH
ncbi:hypothetical protein EVJ58_g6796 [Rhodofomes roseus]|uniref:Transcription elongation factor Eaf N-terminal domain-containing protein n=1 Tax=Rhodofomes roseus TaxID=34475 RepID=A0A4Y9Y5Q8_9APHY|nr:hypothetical protein EVJ58_g6796 [Rhodofomes roseus]